MNPLVNWAEAMATEWFVRRGEKTSGPFSSKQLKSLANSGRLKTEDLVRKGSEGKFFPITRLQGLFDQPIADESPVGKKPSDEEVWSVESPEDSVQVKLAEADQKPITEHADQIGPQTSDKDIPKTSNVNSSDIFANVKRNASNLASHVKSATEKTAKMSSLKFEESTLSTTTLPGLYAKLGEALCRQSVDRTPAEIQTQRDKITELDRQLAMNGTPTTLIGKSKSMAAAGKTIAKRVILLQQLGRMYAAFGEKNFEADEQECEPKEINRQIAAARNRLKEVRQELTAIGHEVQSQMASGMETLKTALTGSGIVSPLRSLSNKVWIATGAGLSTLILIGLLLPSNKSQGRHSSASSAKPTARENESPTKTPSVDMFEYRERILAEMERNPPVVGVAVPESEYSYDFTTVDYETIPLGCKKEVHKITLSKTANDKVRGKIEVQNGYVDTNGHFVEHGTFTTWANQEETIKLRDGASLHGKLHGVLKWYSPDGTVTAESPRVEGKNHGIWREWTPSRTIVFESGFVHGQVHGIHREWYEDGKPKKFVMYDNSKLHGIEKRWWPDGRLAIISCFRQGKRCGKHNSWNEDGSEAEFGEWDDDRPIGKCNLAFNGERGRHYFIAADDGGWHGGTRAEFIARAHYFNLRDFPGRVFQCGPKEGILVTYARTKADFFSRFGLPISESIDYERAPSGVPQSLTDKFQIWTFACTDGQLRLRVQPSQDGKLFINAIRD